MASCSLFVISHSAGSKSFDSLLVWFLPALFVPLFSSFSILCYYCDWAFFVFLIGERSLPRRAPALGFPGKPTATPDYQMSLYPHSHGEAAGAARGLELGAAHPGPTISQ